MKIRKQFTHSHQISIWIFVCFRKHRSVGRLFESIDEFFDALTTYQQQQQQTSPHHSSTSMQSIPPTPRPASPAAEEASNSSMLSELRSMEQSRLCKICYKQPSNVVFIPCGHLACCTSCSNENLRRCPVCHRGIQEKIKAFRSWVNRLDHCKRSH